MKKRPILLLITLLTLLSCSQRKLPNYPATDEGITRMRLDSAAFFMAKHDTRNAMYQLKSAEKHLFNVTEDSLKFATYYRIALLNAQMVLINWHLTTSTILLAMQMIVRRVTE